MDVGRNMKKPCLYSLKRMSQKKIHEQTGFSTEHLQEELMNSLQKNCRLQCLDEPKEIEGLTMMVSNLQIEHLDQFK